MGKDFTGVQGTISGVSEGGICLEGKEICRCHGLSSQGNACRQHHIWQPPSSSSPSSAPFTALLSLPRWGDGLPHLPEDRVQRGEPRLLASVRGLQKDPVENQAGLQGQQDLRGVCPNRGSQGGESLFCLCPVASNRAGKEQNIPVGFINVLSAQWEDVLLVMRAFACSVAWSTNAKGCKGSPASSGGGESSSPLLMGDGLEPSSCLCLLLPRR